MSERPSFEEMRAVDASLLAALDQMIAVSAGMMRALATYEQACIANGMSGVLAAVFTLRLAEGYGWPVFGASS